MAHVFAPRLTAARVEPPLTSTPSIPLAVKRATLTLDATWAPYVQGSLSCVRQSSSDATATDPRKGMLTKFTLQQSVDGGAVQSLNVAAWLRSRVNDFGVDESTLTFTSVESILQDYIDSAGNQYAAQVTDLTIVQDALSRVDLFNGHGGILSGSAAAASFNVAAADAGWDAGTSTWDVINSAESAKSTWLHGDESGLTLFRHPAGYSADTSTLYMYGADNGAIVGRIISVTDTIDRDSSDWANAAVINYAWNKGASTASDYGTAPGVAANAPIKTLIVNRNGRRTTTGEALARATRANKRGRTLVVQAVMDLSVRPNRPCYVGFKDAWYGIVRSVTFTIPDGTMTVTVDITES